MRNEFILRASAEDRKDAPEKPAESAVPRPPAADETQRENEILIKAGWRLPVKDSGQGRKRNG